MAWRRSDGCPLAILQRTRVPEHPVLPQSLEIRWGLQGLEERVN